MGLGAKISAGYYFLLIHHINHTILQFRISLGVLVVSDTLDLPVGDSKPSR
jgi:hypothetical protein